MYFLAIQAHYGKKVYTTAPTSTNEESGSEVIDTTERPSVAIDCENLAFDAICQHKIDGVFHTFAFFRDKYVELTEAGVAPVKKNYTLLFISSLMTFRNVVLLQGYPRLIADDWFGVTRVEACLTFLSEYTLTTLDSGEITYLFFNGSYKVFVNLQPIGFKRNITLNWSLPATPNAAFQWSRTGLVYFAIGDAIFHNSSTVLDFLA